MFHAAPHQFTSAVYHKPFNFITKTHSYFQAPPAAPPAPPPGKIPPGAPPPPPPPPPPVSALKLPGRGGEGGLTSAIQNAALKKTSVGNLLASSDSNQGQGEFREFGILFFLGGGL